MHFQNKPVNSCLCPTILEVRNFRFLDRLASFEFSEINEFSTQTSLVKKYHHGKIHSQSCEETELLGASRQDENAKKIKTRNSRYSLKHSKNKLSLKQLQLR